MGGDMANAELGVAITDNQGAKTRLGERNKLEKQHAWSRQYLGERTIAMLFLLCLTTLTVIWTMEVSAIIRYGITTTVLILALFLSVGFIRRKSALMQSRDADIKAYTNEPN